MIRLNSAAAPAVFARDLHDHGALALELADLTDRELRFTGEHAAETDLERHRLAGIEPDLVRRRRAAPGFALCGSVIASAPAQPASASTSQTDARPIDIGWTNQRHSQAVIAVSAVEAVTKLGITLGDPAGIGPEIVAAALARGSA